MGSLEAIMASASFALFGMTGFALQLVPLLWSLALIVVMFFLGKELGGRHVGRIAALLTAIPPVGLVVWSTKARGGFIEILVLGALAMYITSRWFKSSARVTTYPIVTGLVLGTGWWVNDPILYAADSAAERPLSPSGVESSSV
jgi:4-amino-4-deoxy-L-arabinose transferase-like glycosyltransferase